MSEEDRAILKEFKEFILDEFKIKSENEINAIGKILEKSFTTKISSNNLAQVVSTIYSAKLIQRTNRRYTYCYVGLTICLIISTLVLTFIN